MSARLDDEVEGAQDTDARMGRVAEVDTLEADTALDRIGDVALGGLGVDLRDGVEQADDVRGGALGRENVGDEGEDVAGLDGGEDGGHEADEELERGPLEVCDLAGAEPEDEGDDEERERLRERKDRVGDHRGAVRAAHGALERVAVERAAVVLARERGDGADRARGLARELRGRLMGLLIVLVLEHDDAQADVARGDEDGRAGDADEADLLVEDEAEDGADDERGDGLHDRAEGDAHKAIDLLRVVEERGGECAGVVLALSKNSTSWRRMVQKESAVRCAAGM